MTARVDVRMMRSAVAGEVYITAAPTDGLDGPMSAEEAFTAIRKTVAEHDAQVFQERIFGASVSEDLLAARAAAYGRTDDGVPPAVLAGRDGARASFWGVQVHAVCGGDKLQVITDDGKPCGRVFEGGGSKYLALSGLHAGREGAAIDQAAAMLARAKNVLRQFGEGFLSVPRTWMWLGDILSWYGDFNRARNLFFEQEGLIGKGGRQSMPASTGIGLSLAGAGACGMDLTAVLAPHNSIEFLAAIGRQQCALAYGSAFSRASQALTPAGRTVFVSGTASIDASGATTNVGDIDGQIKATIENVRAVLRDMACCDKDIVQGIAYCKTPEIEQAFRPFRRKLSWPLVTGICDICREDLLFEIEVTAMLPHEV